MTLEEKRDVLLRQKSDYKLESEYSKGYVDGVLDLYNLAKKEELCHLKMVGNQ